MITIYEARARARRYLDEHLGPDASSVRIMPNAIEKPYGWIFFFNSSEYLDTGDPSLALAGNGPLVVLRDSGKVIQLDTAHPVEESVARFAARLRERGLT